MSSPAESQKVELLEDPQDSGTFVSRARAHTPQSPLSSQFFSTNLWSTSLKTKKKSRYSMTIRHNKQNKKHKAKKNTPLTSRQHKQPA